MRGMTRRGWIKALGSIPVLGGLALWVDGKLRVRAEPGLSPRERFQRRHFPNVELITHEGEKVRFYDDLIRGKRVAVNFMYATCENICVPTTMNLVRVQKLLGDRVGKDIFFYSITLKPEVDTPETLKKYARMHGVGPGWLFLTGRPEDVERLRRSLGFTYIDPELDADDSQHVGMVRYGYEPLMWWGAAQGLANPKHIHQALLWTFDSVQYYRPPQ